MGNLCYKMLCDHLFYINYEECKYEYKEEAAAITESFILTMRNVNPDKGGEGEEGQEGFILTMRNVNVNLPNDTLLNEDSFILTMRNVNR